jgi:hypothetical protein
MKPRKPALTIDLFVFQIQPGPFRTRKLSLLLDTSSGQLEELPGTDTKYDTPHKHANYQDDCEAAPVGGICNCGYYGHFCFVDNDDYLPCVAVVDARNDCLLWLTSEGSRREKRDCRVLVRRVKSQQVPSSMAILRCKASTLATEVQIDGYYCRLAVSNDSNGVPRIGIHRFILLFLLPPRGLVVLRCRQSLPVVLSLFYGLELAAVPRNDTTKVVHE